MDFGVVIVNYRTPKLVADCLRALANEIGEPARGNVVIVDNDSGDDSRSVLARLVDANKWLWAELLPLERNVGYSAGNNAALKCLLSRADPPEFVLLLNPDTVVRPGAVDALLSFMRSHPDVGIAGSRLEDPDGTPQRSAFRFPGVASELDGGLRFGAVSRWLSRYVVAPPVRDEPHPADWVAGASMMIRRTVFDQIGFFDEGYFLYFEEVDFCLRAHRAGWECWYVPTSRVVHLVGQSTGVTDTRRVPRRLPRYWFESRRRYFRKNHGRVYAFCADAAWATGFTLWRLRRWLQNKPDPDPPYMLGDFLRYSFLPGPTGARP